MKSKFPFLAICILAFLSLLTAHAAALTVYVAVRTDGLPGMGTQADPFNGSTQTKFDALMQSFPANTQINLGAGTFMTNGYEGFSVKAGQVIQGAGMGVTILKLAGLPANGYHKHYHLSGYGCTGLQVSNITFDGNYQGYNWAANEAVGGICPFGSNIMIDSVEVINCYGVGTAGNEQFSIVVGGTGLSDMESNCMIKNCVTHNYAPGANYTNGAMVSYCTSAQIVNCTDDGANHGFGFTGVSNGEITGCTTTRNTNTDFYTDTDTVDHITIDENSFSSTNGIPIQFTSRGATYITISDNAMETSNSSGSGSAAIVLGTAGKHFTITGNAFTYNGTNWSGLILNNGKYSTDLDVENNSSNVGLIGGGGSPTDVTDVGVVEGNHFNEPIASLTPPPGSPGASTVGSDSAPPPASPAPDNSGDGSSNSGSTASNGTTTPPPSTPPPTPPDPTGDSSNSNPVASSGGTPPPSTPPPSAPPASTPPSTPPPTTAQNSPPDEDSPEQLVNQVQHDTAVIVQQDTVVATQESQTPQPGSGSHRIGSGGRFNRPMAENVPGENAVKQVHNKFLHEGPYGAADYVRSLPEGPGKEEAVNSLMRDWTVAAPAGVAKWAAGLPEGSFRDSTVRFFSGQSAQP